jgi:SAM-dependent methyltransferase
MTKTLPPNPLRSPATENGALKHSKQERELSLAAKEPVETPAPQDLNERRHPEHQAGGYACDDGYVEFYQRVVAVLPQGGAVLDLGAGRGNLFETKGGSWRDWLIRLADKPSRRVGADVDPIVKTNPGMDEAVVIEPGKPLPFADQSFDLVLCDWVVEHIEDPEAFVAEVRRILKIGGWFCARTPNRWSYFSVGARLLSGAAETRIIGFLQPHREEQDVFKKYYRMNTLGAIARQFATDHWINATYTHNPDPGYVGNSPFLYNLVSLYQKLAPKSLATTILIFARRIV